MSFCNAYLTTTRPPTQNPPRLKGNRERQPGVLSTDVDADFNELFLRARARGALVLKLCLLGRAARGRAARLLTPAQESSIAAAWERRAPTLETTRLGGGIGFHGWAREWEDTGPRHLSWGCVVLHLSDIQDFYDRLPAGAMVVIF